MARELLSLSSTDREAVLLELRSHLTDQAARGDESLDAALRALGSPADLAAEFDQARGAGLVQVPQIFAAPWRPMRVSEVLLEVRATLLASRDGLMMVGLVITAVSAAAAFLSWTSLRLSGGVGLGDGAEKANLVAVMLVLCAGYRIVLSDDPHPWRITPSTFRFLAAALTMDLIGSFATSAVFRGVTSFVSAAGATPIIVNFAAAISSTAFVILFCCVALRIQPWLVAQAIGRYEIGIGASWRGTSGWVLNIVLAWIVLVMPLYLLNLGLQVLVPKFVPIGIATQALAVVSAVLTMVIMFAMLLLNATIYRWAVGEPIPAARPFATEPADASTIQEARARLAMLLASRQTGQES